MIIVRSPMRITLGGGGTDLPAWYRINGGALISAAINKYIYLTGSERRFDHKYWISYSTVEVCDAVDQIRNEMFAKCLAKYDLPDGVEIHSISEVPGNSGLGSSGTFIVGTLTVLNALCRKEMTRQELAEQACAIEMIEMGRSSGKQDQYIAAYGGIIYLEIDQQGTVKVSRLSPAPATLTALNNNILLYHTGCQRDANSILQTQSDGINQNSTDMLKAMARIQEIGLQSKAWILSGDVDAFGRSLHLHWEIKRSLLSQMSTPALDAIYNHAMESGALGGKIMGAGGGGCFMFYVPPANQAAFRRHMSAKNLVEFSWQFDFQGATVIYFG